jgi:hypothetical protein
VDDARMAEAGPREDGTRRLDGLEAAVEAHHRPARAGDLGQLEQRPDGSAADVDDARRRPRRRGRTAPAPGRRSAAPS